MGNEQELLRCPFCGCAPISQNDENCWEIFCECFLAALSVFVEEVMTDKEIVMSDLSVYNSEYIARAKKEAIKQWNTRA